MSTPIPFPPPGFDDLSTDEQIDYLASLWDRITTPPTTIDVPQWHREVIVERLRDLDSDPNTGDKRKRGSSQRTNRRRCIPEWRSYIARR